MALVKDKKKEVIKKFAEHEKDTGSCNVQIALITGALSLKKINPRPLKLLKNSFKSKKALKLIILIFLKPKEC